MSPLISDHDAQRRTREAISGKCRELRTSDVIFMNMIVTFLQGAS